MSFLLSRAAVAVSLAIGLLIHWQSDCLAQPSAPACPADWVCTAKPILSPATKIGAWYSLMFQAPGDAFKHWSHVRYQPPDGQYSSGDPQTVKSQFEQLRAVGVDYVLLDDSNGIANDQGAIESNAQSIFDTDDALPKEKRLPLAFVLGVWNPGFWNAHTPDEMLPHVRAEANNVFSSYSGRPSYFHWKRRPLLVLYGPYDTNAPPAALRDWSDSRFTIRHASYHVNIANPYIQQYAREGLWGWFLPEPQLSSAETIAVSPGYYRRHIDPKAPVIEREDGQHYMREWLFAIKQHPENIVIASWNDFVEETQVAPSVSVRGVPYTDSYGDETPDWYAQITSAYAHLRTGLMPGVYYGEEDGAAFFQVVDGKLVRRSTLPHGQPVIRLPAGSLEGLPGNL